MPKVTYQHLEEVKKTLKNSNKLLKAIVEPLGNPKNNKIRKVIQKNNQTIEMLDEEYLNIKS